MKDIAGIVVRGFSLAPSDPEGPPDPHCHCEESRCNRDDEAISGRGSNERGRGRGQAPPLRELPDPQGPHHTPTENGVGERLAPSRKSMVENVVRGPDSIEGARRNRHFSLAPPDPEGPPDPHCHCEESRCNRDDEAMSGRGSNEKGRGRGQAPPLRELPDPEGSHNTPAERSVGEGLVPSHRYPS